MSLDSKILDRMDELAEQGKVILDTYAVAASKAKGIALALSRFEADSLQAHQWGMSCLNLLERVFGKDSSFVTRFNARYNGFPRIKYFDEAYAILLSARDEYNQGFLFDTKTLIEAEVFDDFLEQAEHLFEAGYSGPAAVIAGSVLEDGLRKLCGRVGIALPDKPRLDQMNADLAKKGIYNKLVQKQITALADLRNKAAHGQWDQFTDEDVKNMLSQVRSIMANHFS